MKAPAFTIIELLIVISIIGILAGVASLDFQNARQAQAMNLAQKQITALFQQGRAEVAAGRFDEGGVQCLGAYLEEDGIIERAVANFNAEIGLCEGLSRQIFGRPNPEVIASELTVGTVPVDALWAFYVPPNGDLKFYSTLIEDEELSGSLVIVLKHKRNEELEKTLEISPLTQTILPL